MSLAKRIALIITILFVFSVPAVAQMPPQAKDDFDKAFKLSKQQDWCSALGYYIKALKLAPDEQDIWVEYTICLRHVNMLQRAAQAGWRALELGAASAGKWGNLGNVFVQARAWDAAASAFEEAAKITSNKRWAGKNFVNLGYEQRMTGDFTGARKSLNRAREIDPTSGMALVDLAMVEAGEGHTKEALARCDQAQPLLQAVGDDAGLAYLSMVRSECGSGKKPWASDSFQAYQVLPKRFLERPVKGQSLSLAVDVTVQKRYHLPKIGVVCVAVPENWAETMGDRKSPPTVKWESVGRDDFRLLWTPMPPSIPQPPNIRKIMQEAGEKSLPQAVEKRFSLKNFESATVRGCYFQLTDKDCVGCPPRQDDYPYMLQAATTITGQNWMNLLTVLARDKEPDHIQAFIAVMQSMSMSVE